jgi:BlaI family transcriptional regulator, penicillinase repressor
MAKQLLPRPTDAEIDILRILWQLGPSTVKDVHEEIRLLRDTRLTTTLKQMQVMTEKGLLRREESRRPHLYTPQLTQDRTLRQLVGGLLEHAFGGSADRLVMHALEARKVTPEELARIRQVLDRLEEKPK